MPRGGHQRGTGVEADVRFAGDERVARKPRIGAGILHHEDFAGVLDGMRAKGQLACDLERFYADPGLEPLPIPVDQRDQSDRGPTDICRRPRQVVVGGVCEPIQLELVERALSPSFAFPLVIDRSHANPFAWSARTANGRVYRSSEPRTP